MGVIQGELSKCRFLLIQDQIPKGKMYSLCIMYRFIANRKLVG